MQTLLIITTAIFWTSVSAQITATYRPQSSADADSRALNVATGAKVSFNWTVNVPPKGRIISITWLYERYGQNNVTLASLINDRFYPRVDDSVVTFLPNAGLQLSSVVPEDSGRYFVIAQVAGEDGRITTFENWALLYVSAFLTEVHRCPDDWVHFEYSCYAFLDVVEPWSTAVEMCRQLDSSLLLITNERENDFIAAQLRIRHGTGGNHWYWVNINDLVREGRWVHGAREPATYLRWAAGQPNNGMASENGEDCAAITSDGTWHDLWCQDFPRGAYLPRPVCEMSAV